jgi:hypothetical protein
MFTGTREANGGSKKREAEHGTWTFSVQAIWEELANY